jgi:hypothetical protein
VALVFARGCPAREKEGHRREGAEIAGFAQICVPDGVRVRRQAAAPQIHQEKRKIVEDVDAGDVVVELDRIEQRRHSFQQHDVAKM